MEKVIYDVFFSYSQKNTDTANHICAALGMYEDERDILQSNAEAANWFNKAVE